jgi:hypothetical protein
MEGDDAVATLEMISTIVDCDFICPKERKAILVPWVNSVRTYCWRSLKNASGWTRSGLSGSIQPALLNARNSTTEQWIKEAYLPEAVRVDCVNQLNESERVCPVAASWISASMLGPSR